MLIFVLSNDEGLLSIFQDYCCETEHRVIVQKQININFFFEILYEKIPAVVFIDFKQAQHIFDAPEWDMKQTFVKKHYIKFCGMGELPAHENVRVRPFLDRFLLEQPISLEAITNLLCTIRGFGVERRSGDNRRKTQRRKSRSTMAREATFVNQSASLKRAEASRDQIGLLETCTLGPLKIDYSTKVISVRGVPVEMSPTEFSFLDLLSQQPDCVVTIEDIICYLWPGKQSAAKSDVHQYVYMLRNKLEKDPHAPEILLTVRGFGYKICP